MHPAASSYVFLALALVAVSTSAQVAYPVTTASFAEPVLLGMKLSVKRGVADGSASPKRARCVDALPQDSFTPVIAELLRQHLSPSELTAAESFFSSVAGQKYVRQGILQIYQAVGEPLPAPLPSFSNADHKEVKAFASTRAGEQLFKNRVLQSGGARQAYDARIRELLAKCPN